MYEVNTKKYPLLQRCNIQTKSTILPAISNCTGSQEPTNIVVPLSSIFDTLGRETFYHNWLGHYGFFPAVSIIAEMSTPSTLTGIRQEFSPSPRTLDLCRCPCHDSAYEAHILHICTLATVRERAYRNWPLTVRTVATKMHRPFPKMVSFKQVLTLW